MRVARFLGGAAIMLAACGRNVPSGDPAPTIAMADGATDWFGPGVSAVRDDGARLRLDLRQRAHVAGLRIDGRGAVAALAAATLDSGRQWFQMPAAAFARPARVPAQSTAPAPVPDVSTCHTNRVGADGRTIPFSGSCTFVGARVDIPTAPSVRAPVERSAGFVLLIVSDSAFTLDQLNARLAAVQQFRLGTVVHDLPEFLVGRRTAMWAGYLVRL